MYYKAIHATTEICGRLFPLLSHTGVKKKLLNTESQPWKGWGDFGQKEKEAWSTNHAYSPVLFISNFSWLYGKGTKNPARWKEKAASRFSTRPSRWTYRVSESSCRLLLKLSHWEQVRCRIEPQMMPLLHCSQGHDHIEWFWFFLMWNCAFPILACFCIRQYFSI